MPSGQDAADARRPLDRPPTPGGLAQAGRTSGGEPQAATDEGSARSWIRRHAVGIAFALFLAAALVFPRWWLLTTSPPEVFCSKWILYTQIC